MRTLQSFRSFLPALFWLIPLVLAACQGATTELILDDANTNLEELRPDNTLVIYWHGLTGTDADHLLELIDEFNSNNQWNITVVGEYLGDLHTLHNKVTKGIPTGQVPNLVMSTPSLTAAYAAQGVAVALAPYLESRRWGLSQPERVGFFEGTLRSERLPQFGDRLFSFPLCRSLQVLLYNVDWLNELNFEEPPETWEAFREMACAASEPAEGRYGFSFGMESTTFTSLLQTQDISLFNPGSTALTFGDEQGVRALEFLQRLIMEGCAAWETEESAKLSDFAAGNLLFAIDSSDRLSSYEAAIAENANFDWSLSVLPHATEAPLVNVDGRSMTILSSTPKEQLAAWLFVKWLAEPSQQARWAQWMGCFPLSPSASEELDPAYLEQHDGYRLAVQLLGERWVSEPNVAGYVTCRAEVGRMLYAVTAGENADLWLSETATRCNQALETAIDR